VCGKTVLRLKRLSTLENILMKRFLLLATVLGLAMSGAAFGDTYGTLYVGATSSTTPNITVPNVPANSGTGFGNTYRGDYDIRVDSVDSTYAFDDLIGWNEVYCIDSSGSPGVGTYTIMDLQDLAQVSGPEAESLRRMVANLGGIGTGSDAQKAQEQAAAWEIVYGDGLLDLSSTGVGTFQVSLIDVGTAAEDAAALVAAQALLDAIAPDGEQASVFALYNETLQDWAVVSIGGGSNEPVPEPGMIINLLGLALGGGLLGYRRFRR
jgi:hypothetical protein